jgi:HD-GYP domain-containing protein (c-di-GMP phosphodiesterase class II)
MINESSDNKETKKVLIFDERLSEKEKTYNIPPDSDFTIMETSKILDAINLLKSQEISMVLANSNLSKKEKDDFKSLVEMIRPGTNVLFLQPSFNGNGSVMLSSDDFRQYLKNTLQTEYSLNTQLRDFKDFFLSFAERMLQIFGATNSYFYSKDHLVAWLSRKTALKMELSSELADNIQIAALLRDIGMLSIKQQLLEEKKKFNNQELVSVKKHPHNSVQILKQIRFPWNVDAIILQHHENYDGTGYPNGLRGRDISIGARIVHISDSYVAMTTERPYRKALSPEEARGEVIKNTGTHFDPEIAEAFLSVLDEELIEDGDRHSILILERFPDIVNVIKLLVDSSKSDIVSVFNVNDMVENISKNMPDVILADVEIFGKEELVHFFNAMYEVPALQNCSFIFILTDESYPRHFIGDHIRYLSIPLDMGELASSIRSFLGKEKEKKVTKTESKGLSGSIEDFGLADIVQILQLGLKTAQVEISTDEKVGILYLSRGNIVHASIEALTGEEAFFEMMKWEEGTFNILHGVTTNDVNITSETMYLLLEALRQLDESKRGASH